MFVEHHADVVDRQPAVIVEALAPVVKNTELGTNALVLAHLAQHLRLTVRESTIAFDQLMSG
jgi:hypothetical protein